MQKLTTTCRDAYNAATWFNVLMLVLVAAVSAVSVYLVGYVVWRRFVVPAIIITAASIGWAIAHCINQGGLKRVVKAASIGLHAFALALFAGALIDAIAFPDVGHFAFVINAVVWAWITWHLYRALRILKEMPPERKSLVTESTAVIYAQMTYRERRQLETLAEARQKLASIGVTPTF